jgi:hypothetical protein
MTPYIQQQLKKLCDNPNWYDDMLISWDKNPRNQREAIYNYLSHVQLNGLLENTHFKSIQDIEDYFEIVHIEIQELTSIGFKTAILK